MMKKSLTECLKKEILTADGAWGTMLQKKGLTAGDCPELWNLEHPDIVRTIAEEYLNVGAQIIKTNSFGSNKFRLEHYSAADKVYETAKKAAQISREAAGGTSFVFGSMGPTGKMLIMGDVTEEELIETFSIQAQALADGGVDAILLETFSDLDELSAGVKAAKSTAGLPVICSVTFEKNNDGAFRTMMGAGLETFYDRVVKDGADIVGTNCGNGFENTIEIISGLRLLDGNIPILALANAGLPVLEHGQIVYSETPDFIRPLIPRLIDAGANIIGGCCGTSPEHIRVIREVIDKRRA